MEWLDLQIPTKQINKRHSSYGYKHMVERWCGRYISNDSFKEAVKRKDIKWKIFSLNNPNIYISIHEGYLQKTIKKTSKQWND